MAYQVYWDDVIEGMQLPEVVKKTRLPSNWLNMLERLVITTRFIMIKLSPKIMT
ncbi:MAG: hypothetical protein CM1200mP22_07930 [Dehalococcoidia bacterium]|nr:MAG: hypothetical protein CM1200mP22_07930 [Dehalococcoidia bacterium]